MRKLVEVVKQRGRGVAVVCLTSGLWGLPLGAAAQGAGGDEAPRKGIYTCLSSDGRKLTADRPILECSSREQRILNADGSLRGVLAPYLSPEERAAKEAEERRLATERSAQLDAVRRDRNLMLRFPNEAAHQRARASALDDANKAMQISTARIKELSHERKPLMDEAEFYKGRALPQALKQALDANDVGVEAQELLIENQKADMVRINQRYDNELARLRKLWAGAPPGSLSGHPGDSKPRP